MKRFPNPLSQSAIAAHSLRKRFWRGDFTINRLLSSTCLQILPEPSSKPVINPLYNLLPETQNPNKIVDLICSALKQRESGLTLLHDEIKSLIPRVGDPEISRVLLRFQSDASRALTFFNWVKYDVGRRPNVLNYCLLLHIIAWSKRFPLAMRFLCELIEYVAESSSRDDVFKVLISATGDCNWDPVIFDMLVKGYLKMGMIQDGFLAFRKVIDAGFLVSIVTCNHLLNGLMKLNCTDKCWEVYQVMGRSGIHPNTHTFNILTNIFCHDSDIEKVNDFLEKMEEEGFEPDLVTYNTLVSSYCRKGRLEDAFYMYRIMYRRGVVPDLVTHTSLIKGLCKEGRVKEARETFYRMIHRGITPDDISYNTLIYAYCKERMMEESKSLLLEMIGNSIVPDRFTCMIIVEGYAREGRLVAAVNLTAELRRLGISIPSEVYDYLIVSLCRDGRPFAAKNLLERISEEGYEGKPEVYNKLLDYLCQYDAIDEALLLKRKIMKQNMATDVNTYRALICCLCRVGRNQEAESLMREMVDSNLTPDSYICGALIDGYCKELNVDKAESLLCFFSQEFGVIDTGSYNSLVKAICEAGDGNKLIDLQERMQRLGFVPNSITCKFMIQGLSRVKQCNVDVNGNPKVGLFSQSEV